MDPRATLTAFDRYLADRGLALDAVVVGGAALNLLGLVTRQTRDCDIIHCKRPSAVKPWYCARCTGRTLLKVKLFALCDRGLDLPDCVALAPTPVELAEAVAWLEPQDLNPGWPAHVRTTLDNLARRLGHGP